jgi:hypothetical protein
MTAVECDNGEVDLLTGTCTCPHSSHPVLDGSVCTAGECPPTKVWVVENDVGACACPEGTNLIPGTDSCSVADCDLVCPFTQTLDHNSCECSDLGPIGIVYDDSMVSLVNDPNVY